jgi:DNA-binding transcriptional ArsR family regulator
MSHPGKSKSRKHAAGINAKVFKALSHPLRCRILTLLDERVASPKEIEGLLEENLHTVCRHIKVLEETECIELVATDKRRGGTQHFYKAIVRPILDTEAAEKLPKLLREAQSVQFIPLVFGDVIESVEARAFDAHPARSLLRTNLVLDDEGMRESGEVAIKCWNELQEVQAQSAGRLAAREEEGMNVSSAILIYQAAGQP